MPTPLRKKRLNDRFRSTFPDSLTIEIGSWRECPSKGGRELITEYYVPPEGKPEREVSGLKPREILKYEFHEMDLRVMPGLRFFWDPTPERADRIDTLLAQLREESEQADANRSEEEAEEDSD